MPSIVEIKDKIQKLVQQQSRLKAEIDLAETEEETVRKTAQAEKLLSQINTLRLTLAKLETQQKPVTTKKTKTAVPVAEKKPAITEVNTNTSNGSKPEPKKKVAKKPSLEEIILVEQRINQIEQSQKKTREQLQKFATVKNELTRSKEEAEKHVLQVTQQSYSTNRQLQQEIASLTEQLQLSEARYETLKKELSTIQYQTEKETKSLTDQLNTALDKQNQLEKERARLFRTRGQEGFGNGLLIGLVISLVVIAAFLGVALMTPWLDTVICPSHQVSNSQLQNQ